MATSINSRGARLRKHADYQRVYKSSRKLFSKQMSYFFSIRTLADGDCRTVPFRLSSGPRIGLTVGKVMGKAVDRNRIKRRLREVVRINLSLLHSPLDVVLHPRKPVLTLNFDVLREEVANIFQSIQRSVDRQKSSERLQSSEELGRRKRVVPLMQQSSFQAED